MSAYNFMKWSDSSDMGKTRIIVDMMDRLEELEKEKAERDSKKGVPETLQFLAGRSKTPKIIS